MEKNNWPPEFGREVSLHVPCEKQKVLSLQDSNLIDLINKMSHQISFKTLLRIVTYILRPVKHLRKQQKNSHHHCGSSAAF